jgi:hypothetical protein
MYIHRYMFSVVHLHAAKTRLHYEWEVTYAQPGKWQVSP